MVLIFVPDLNGYFRVYLIFRHAHMCIYNYIYTYIVYDLYGVSRRKTWDEADEYFHFLGHSPSCILTCFSTWEPAGLSIFKSSAGNLMAGPISPFHPHIFIYIYSTFGNLMAISSLIFCCVWHEMNDIAISSCSIPISNARILHHLVSASFSLRWLDSTDNLRENSIPSTI